jgi:uncharacterized phage protein (TIGR02218 family)
MAELLVNGTKAFATLWIITRIDGTSLRFTDHDRPLRFDDNDDGTAETFTPVGALQSSAHERQAGFQESNFDAVGAITDDQITDEDLRAGLYNDAQVEEILVDWRAPWAGSFSREKWWIGSVSYDGEKWRGQLTSLKPWLRRKVGRVFGRTCGWNLGEFNATTGFGCHYSLTANREAFVVQSVTIPRLKIVTDLAAAVDPTGELFNNGFVEWIAPAKMVGVRTPVKIQTNGANISVEFFLKTPLEVAPTTWAGWLNPGCNKLLPTCVLRGQFPARFGGFNMIVGTDKSVETPDAKA